MPVKRLVRIFAWTLGSVLTLLGIAVGIAYVYEDDMKAYAVNQLNAYLQTEVFVDDIRLSLIQKFPSASIEFTQVMVNGNHEMQETDTLLYASSILMEFNIWDLWDENYTVKSMEVRNADMNVFVDENGVDNFHIFKPREDSLQDAFQFELENILFQNTDVRYTNLNSATVVDFGADNINLDGQFAQNQFDLQNNSIIALNELSINDFTYVKHRDVATDINLHVNYETQEYHINTGTFSLEDMLFNITGMVTQQDDYMDCNLQIASNQLTLHALASILPSEVEEKLNQYQSSGLLVFHGAITGPIGTNQSPDITASFKINDGTVSETSTAVALNNIALVGQYQNRMNEREEVLVVSECNAILKDKPVNLSFEITEFNNPAVDFSFDGSIDLEELQAFAQIETVERMSGQAAINLKFSGMVDEINEFSSHFNDVQLNGNASVTDAQLQIIGSDVNYQFESADGTFSQNVLTVNANGSAGSSNVMCQAVVQNLFSYLFFSQPLAIDAQVIADEVNVPEFLKDSDNRTAAPTEREVNFNVNLKANKIRYSNFTATNLNSVFTWKNRILTASNISFQSAGGNVNGNLEIDLNQAPYPVASNASFSQIRVEDVFYQFNNFAQDFVTHNNLNGQANAQVSFLAQLDAEYHVLTNTVESIAELEVQDGELIGQQTLIEIGGYMRENTTTKVLLGNNIDDFEKRMNRVKFEKLDNTITISNGKVYIPAMDINSDALDINLSGDHAFDNSVDYKFNFRYRDLKKEQESEFGPVKDDGTGIRIFLAMRGTTDNPIFEVDKDSRKEQNQEKLEEETNTLKSILNEEFGLFKNDTTITDVPEEKDNAPEFIIDWDEMKTEEDEIEATEDSNKTGFDKFLNSIGISTEEDELIDDDDF